MGGHSTLYCSYYYSSERDVIFLGRKCLHLNKKDLLVSGGELFGLKDLHCQILNSDTISKCYMNYRK